MYMCKRMVPAKAGYHFRVRCPFPLQVSSLVSSAPRTPVKPKANKATKGKNRKKVEPPYLDAKCRCHAMHINIMSSLDLHTCASETRLYKEQRPKTTGLRACRPRSVEIKGFPKKRRTGRHSAVCCDAGQFYATSSRRRRKEAGTESRRIGRARNKNRLPRIKKSRVRRVK